MTKSVFIKVVAGAGGVAVWLAVWQIATTVGPMSNVLGIPSMSAAVGEAVTMAGDEDFWIAIWETVVMAFLGLVIALVVGLALGLVTGVSAIAHRAADPTIQFLRPLPAIVILPLALMVFGPTRELGIFLAAFGAVWPILVQTQIGVRDVDPVALDSARSMALSWARTQRSVVLPSATPFILTGVRIAASGALLLAIGAGLLGGAPGLGRVILIAQQAGLTDRAFGLILWGGLLGLVLALLLTYSERLLVRGRRPMEEAR